VPFSLFVKSEKYSFWKSIVKRSVGFSFIYVLICLLIIPPLAKKEWTSATSFFFNKRNSGEKWKFIDEFDESELCKTIVTRRVY
jgi:hypothetical protein